MEEPPESCGPRASSNTQCDCLCYQCRPTPAMRSYVFTGVATTVNRPRSPTVPMTRNNQPFGPGRQK